MLREVLEFAIALESDEHSTVEELSLISGKSKSYIAEARRLRRNLHIDIQSRILRGESTLTVGLAAALSKLSLEAQKANLEKFEKRSRPRNQRDSARTVNDRVRYLRSNPRVISPGALDLVFEVLDFLEGKKSESSSRFINSKFGQGE
jgi:vacuolar-type H+-ATPase subunit I/STV1